MVNQGAANHLQAAFDELAPNAKTVQALARVRANMELDGETEEAVCISIAIAIVDGLRYGNWP